VKLIIHHHSLVFQNSQGYWFPSFIGAWLDEISMQFEDVVFIGEMSQGKLENQDFLINKPNFRVEFFGVRGICSSSKKKAKIKQLGKELSTQYSHLIIRGITPRQYQVFSAFKGLSSSFLMVGSLKDSKPTLKANYVSIIVWLLFFLRRHQLKLISKKSRIFANSPLIVSELNAFLNVKSEFVPTNTLRNHHFTEFAFRGFQPKPVLLFCGRVVKDKGIEELILAMGKLKKSGTLLKLHIVGSITESYKKYLEKLIIEEGIEGEVFFEGFKKFGEELLSFFRMADLYVLPSYHEGFPHTIWEASSTSTPIITTKVGGIPGLVSEKEVFFTLSKSVDQLSNSIEKVINNPVASEKTAHAAFNLARQFTIENCVRILKDKIIRE
jgi:glycosyltransferase involved in cell wall biosynthesis